MNKIIIEDYSWNENDSEFEVAFYHSGYTGEAVVLEEKFKVKDFETFLSQQGYLDLKYYAVLEEGDEKNKLHGIRFFERRIAHTRILVHIRNTNRIF
jgi:hypothetical protein